MERLKQYLVKASFSCEADRFSALECLVEIANEKERMRSALLIAQAFCNSLSAEDCPDAVAIPINEALKVPNARNEGPAL